MLSALRKLVPDPPDEAALVFDVFGGASRGTMIDVGACTGSAFRRFAADGWAVHAFEPDPRNRSALEDAYGGSAGVTIDPRAVSNTPGEQVAFYTSDVSPGISSMTAFHESHVETSAVINVSRSQMRIIL